MKKIPLPSAYREIDSADLTLKDSPLMGHLVCFATQCTPEGGVKEEKLGIGRTVLGSWGKKGDAASWEVNVPESGEYVIEMTCSSPKECGVKIVLKAGGIEKPIRLPQTCRDSLFSQTVSLGSMQLTQGKQRISVQLDEDSSKSLWLDSLRIIPKKDGECGIKLYPENFYRVNGMRFKLDEKLSASLPVLRGVPSLANLVFWRIDVPKKGRYRVEIDFACSSPGWKACLKLGRVAEWVWSVPSDSGSERLCKTLVFDECPLDAGHLPVSLSAAERPASVLPFMDVYAVRLIPVEGGSETGD